MWLPLWSMTGMERLDRQRAYRTKRWKPSTPSFPRRTTGYSYLAASWSDEWAVHVPLP